MELTVQLQQKIERLKLVAQLDTAQRVEWAYANAARRSQSLLAALADQAVQRKGALLGHMGAREPSGGSASGNCESPWPPAIISLLPIQAAAPAGSPASAPSTVTRAGFGAAARSFVEG